MTALNPSGYEKQVGELALNLLKDLADIELLHDRGWDVSTGAGYSALWNFAGSTPESTPEPAPSGQAITTQYDMNGFQTALDEIRDAIIVYQGFLAKIAQAAPSLYDND